MALQVRQSVKLGGINLRQEPADAEDHDLLQVTNLDPYRTPGTLTVRRGQEPLLATSVFAHIRTLGKVNGNRYQVAARVPYRAMEAIVGPVLAEELETHIVGFRPLNDTAIWAFFADDELMFKDDGERTYVWGLETLPEPGPKVANQTGKISGDVIPEGRYGIAVTQIRWDLEG